MNRRQVVRGLLAGASGALLPIGARANDVVRVAEQPIDASLEVSYAQAQGFAAQAGLTVDITLLPSNGAANLGAMAGGSIDIAIANTFSILAANDRGIPLVIVAPSTIYTSKAPSTFLMVPKDSPVQGARDLNGKTVAVNALKNITQYGPMAWIDKNGGDSRGLRFVEMPFGDMAIALATHRVDAACMAEPFASSAVESRVLSAAYDGIASTFLISAWVASRSWAAAHGDTIKAFARMVYRTADWANRNREATAETLVRITHVAASTAKSLPRATFSEHYEVGLIAPVIDVAFKYGGISKTVRAEDLVSPDMPQRA